MAFILTEKRDSTGIITLNHAEKRNALSETLIEEITSALEGFRALEIRAVVLRAQPGIKVWSAGHDVNELPLRGRDPLGWNDPLRILIRSIQEFPAPVIGMIEGSVWGGACEVAMACNILIATPDAAFAITPAKLGVPYNLGGLMTLINMIPLPIVKEMLFTAQPLPADQALNLGIINYIKANDEIGRVENALIAERRHADFGAQTLGSILIGTGEHQDANERQGGIRGIRRRRRMGTPPRKRLRAIATTLRWSPKAISLVHFSPFRLGNSAYRTVCGVARSYSSIPAMRSSRMATNRAPCPEPIVLTSTHSSSTSSTMPSICELFATKCTSPSKSRQRAPLRARSSAASPADLRASASGRVALRRSRFVGIESTR